MALPIQPSKKALAIQQKWQEAANVMGGSKACIVVNKIKAKRLIFEVLHNAFKPMNITDLYKTLKAVVPAPVLKSCLDEMSVNVQKSSSCGSNDDLSKSRFLGNCGKKFKTDNMCAQALFIKVGRNSASTLYFVDYSKLDNSGNGISTESRNNLISDVEQSSSELQALEIERKIIYSETEKVLSELTNEKIHMELHHIEAANRELLSRLDHYRVFSNNKKERKRIQGGIDTSLMHWKKRRSKCIEFLCLIEECTEGSVNKKKCIAGDGKIEIESDDAVAHSAVQFAKHHPQSLQRATKRAKMLYNGNKIVRASKIVAVNLNGRGEKYRISVE